MFPVEVGYLTEAVPDYVAKAVEVAWNINLQVAPSLCHADLELMAMIARTGRYPRVLNRP